MPAALADKSDDQFVPGLADESASKGPAPEVKPATKQETLAQPVKRGSLFRLRAVRPDQDTPGSLKANSNSDPSVPDPIAIIETSKGTIKIRLFRQLAPITVANFADLVSKDFYDGLIFHRVEPGFCIQGGDPYGNGTGGYTDPATHQVRGVPLEVNPKLKHNAPGVVAMARASDPNSGSSQFYITLATAPFLDGQYAIFGGVISGMDVVQSIKRGDKINSIRMREAQ